MIVMNLKLNNFFAFDDFEINFSFPKKILNSTLENEFLPGYPGFRYKKLIILMGANASGKTSIGKSLMSIFNFIEKKDKTHLSENIRSKNKSASFSIDFVLEKNILYRVNCEFGTEDIIKLDLFSAKIIKKDSYEKTVQRLEKIKEINDNDHYIKKLEFLSSFGWFFTFPETNSNTLLNLKKNPLYLDILEKILISLDPHIKSVKKSKEMTVEER